MSDEDGPRPAAELHLQVHSPEWAKSNGAHPRRRIHSVRIRRPHDVQPTDLDIRKILDVTTVDWGVEVTLAEREKRATITNAELGFFLAREAAAAGVHRPPPGKVPMPAVEPAAEPFAGSAEFSPRRASR